MSKWSIPQFTFIPAKVSVYSPINSHSAEQTQIKHIHVFLSTHNSSEGVYLGIVVVLPAEHQTPTQPRQKQTFHSDINHQNTTTQGGGQEKKKENGKVVGIFFESQSKFQRSAYL